MKTTFICMVVTLIGLAGTTHAADYAIRNKSNTDLRFWLWCKGDGDWATLANNSTSLAVGANKRWDLEHHEGAYKLIIKDSDGIQVTQRIKLKDSDRNSFSIHAAFSTPAGEPPKKTYMISRDE